MPENNCVNHFDRTAVGFCSRCNNPVCLDCLDLELGQPLCVNCKGKKAGAMPAVPKAPPPLINPVEKKDPPMTAPGTQASKMPLGGFDAKSDPLKIIQTTLPPSPILDMNPFPPKANPGAPPAPSKPAVPAPVHLPPINLNPAAPKISPVMPPTASKPVAQAPINFSSPNLAPLSKANPAPVMKAPTPAPAATTGSSPLSFKGKDLGDDPLGLFGGPSAPAKPAPEPSVKPAVEPPAMVIKPVEPPIETKKPAVEPPLKPDLGLSSLGAVPKQPAPQMDAVAKAPEAAKKQPLPYDLETLIQEPKPLRPPFPEAHAPEPNASPVPSHLPFPSGPVPPIPVTPVKKKHKILLLGKIWLKFLGRRSYEIFEPTAKKLKLPTYVFLILLAAVSAALLTGIITLIHRPSVALADTIPPIHIVQVNAGQIGEMDVTTYSDLQGQIQKMGFTSILQMTIPQLPSPNFFDVSMKEDIGTYAEILKTPGQITPHLSFVTVFTNGTWLSTNGWDGTAQETDEHISGFYPGDSPDQLYVKHVAAVDKMKQGRDLQTQIMSENRYMAALSDHLRTFLVKKDIPAYKADFALWH